MSIQILVRFSISTYFPSKLNKEKIISSEHFTEANTTQNKAQCKSKISSKLQLVNIFQQDFFEEIQFYEMKKVSCVLHTNKTAISQNRMQCVLPLGGSFTLRGCGKKEAVLLTAAFYPSSQTHLCNGCLVRKTDKDSANSGQKKMYCLTESVCPQTPTLLLLTYFLLFGYEEQETMYQTHYFIVFVSGIFSVW